MNGCAIGKTVASNSSSVFSHGSWEPAHNGAIQVAGHNQSVEVWRVCHEDTP